MHRRRGELVHPLGRTDELEAPRQGGRRTENLRIEKVAHPHDRPADAHGDHDAVERPDVRQPVLARKEPQPDEQADGRAVACHAAVAEPRDDGPRFRKVLHRIVEEAVAEPRAEDRRQRAVNENRTGNLLRKPFALAEVVEKPGSDQNGQRPHQSVVTNVERSETDENRIEIPDNAQRLYHLFKFVSPFPGSVPCRANRPAATIVSRSLRAIREHRRTGSLHVGKRLPDPGRRKFVPAAAAPREEQRGYLRQTAESHIPDAILYPAGRPSSA